MGSRLLPHTGSLYEILKVTILECLCSSSIGFPYHLRRSENVHPSAELWHRATYYIVDTASAKENREQRFGCKEASHCHDIYLLYLRSEREFWEKPLWLRS